jgi:CheY-like chemotaxis protein
LRSTTNLPWIVLVEDDEALQLQLAGALEGALRHIEVRRTPDADDALRLVQDSRSCLLVTEAQSASVDGVTLATCARRQRPLLPLIFIADADPGAAEHGSGAAARTSTHGSHVYPRASTHGSGGEARPSTARVAGFNGSHCIDKPPPLDQFVNLVASVLDAQPGFRGELSMNGLIELVQLVLMTTPTGALRVQSSTELGSVWFEEGAVVHAAQGQERGASAFQRMLHWCSGHFTVEPGVRTTERTITSSTTELLLQSVCLLDEEDRSGLRELTGTCAAECFDNGLAAVHDKRYADALPAWERAALLEPDNRVYRHNLMRLRQLINANRECRFGGR